MSNGVFYCSRLIPDSLQSELSGEGAGTGEFNVHLDYLI